MKLVLLLLLGTFVACTVAYKVDVVAAQVFFFTYLIGMNSLYTSSPKKEDK